MGERAKPKGLFEGRAVDPIEPNASLSDTSLFFLRPDIQEIFSSAFTPTRYGSLSVYRRLTPSAGQIQLGSEKISINAGEKYFSLHFLPEGIKGSKGGVPQADSKGVAQQYLYMGARDLLRAMEDPHLEYRYSYLVGYTNKRLAEILVKHLGFYTFGSIFPEDPESEAVIIPGWDLFNKETRLHQFQKRLEPIVEPRIEQQKRQKLAIIHEVTQKLPIY